MSQAAACAALSDENYFEDCGPKIYRKTKPILSLLLWVANCRKSGKFHFTDSLQRKGKLGRKSQNLCLNLESQNVFVRYFSIIV